jgi:hypothetical protein
MKIVASRFFDCFSFFAFEIKLFFKSANVRTEKQREGGRERDERKRKERK